MEEEEEEEACDCSVPGMMIILDGGDSLIITYKLFSQILIKTGEENNLFHL